MCLLIVALSPDNWDIFDSEFPFTSTNQRVYDVFRSKHRNMNIESDIII